MSVVHWKCIFISGVMSNFHLLIFKENFILHINNIDFSVKELVSDLIKHKVIPRKASILENIINQSTLTPLTRTNVTLHDSACLMALKLDSNSEI